MQLLAGLIGEIDEPGGDDEESGAAIEPEEAEADKPRRKPTGRKPIPEHLPVVEIELIPDDVMAKELKQFERVGEEVLTTVEWRPSAFVRCRVVRAKFFGQRPRPIRTRGV